jgi:hypothetical protein
LLPPLYDLLLEQVLGNPPTKDCHQAYLDSLKKTKALKTAKK